MRQSFHFPKMLKQRTDKTLEELLAKPCEIVLPGKETRHYIVKKKQERYPHQIFLIWEEENLFIGFDPETEKLCTLMYLDGRHGYVEEDYDPKKDYKRKRYKT